MSSNFRFIDKNVDIKDILQQVLDNSQDWGAVSTYENIYGNKNPYGFLPLVMGVVKSVEDNIKDSELLSPTPLFQKYTNIVNWLKLQKFNNISRAAFFRLAPGDLVGRHIDDGKYYLNKDRYHLSLQGVYEYECDGEVHVIKPGTFFWFDNKKLHSAKNISNIDRITFVFDVLKSDNNP